MYLFKSVESLHLSKSAATSAWKSFNFFSALHSGLFGLFQKKISSLWKGMFPAYLTKFLQTFKEAAINVPPQLGIWKFDKKHFPEEKLWSFHLLYAKKCEKASRSRGAWTPQVPLGRIHRDWSQCRDTQSSSDLPPLNNMRLIVPVLPGSVCVHIRVNSGPARHGSRHIRQLGRRKWDVKSEASCSAVLTEEKGLRFLHLQTQYKPEVKFSRYFKSI